MNFLISAVCLATNGGATVGGREQHEREPREVELSTAAQLSLFYL